MGCLPGPVTCGPKGTTSPYRSSLLCLTSNAPKIVHVKVDVQRRLSVGISRAVDAHVLWTQFLRERRLFETAKGSWILGISFESTASNHTA